MLSEKGYVSTLDKKMSFEHRLLVSNKNAAEIRLTSLKIIFNYIAFLKNSQINKPIAFFNYRFLSTE